MNIIHKLQSTILENHTNVDFDLIGSENILQETSNISVYHLNTTVDYYAAYYKGNNLSFVINENNQPLVIFSFFVHLQNNDWVISTNGIGLIGPLFCNSTPKKLRKRLEKQILEIVQNIIDELNIKKITIFETNPNLSSWYLAWLERATKDYLVYQMAVDLGKDIDEIRLNFRKSYKPLVNKALKEWQVEVCDQDNEHIFEEFRLLHLEAAGKQTRSNESWNIQRKQIKDNEAFLVTVRDNELLIGAGLFNYSRDEGMYSVAAYKRELFNKPIGHAVQMVAIQKLKELGCLTYNLGPKATKLDSIFTEKEISISHFKEGFSGYIYAQPFIDIDL